MGPIENLTPFGVACLPNVDRAGDEIMVIALAAHYALPPPGRPHRGPLELCEDQGAPHFDDLHWGEPGVSGLRYEGQSAYDRPGTDIYLNGSAHAPGGRAVAQVDVEVAVGPCRASARVIGDRVWVNTAGTLSASPPVPFVRMPLLWSRAFGGGRPELGARGYEARNPVGVGLYEDVEAATEAPLPNIEDPHALVRESWSRPDPVGFGPVARHWAPRAHFAGTYDDAWTQERAPLWPEDFDERFFLAAVPGLQAIPHLRGGEPVSLAGLDPGGGHAFLLPALRVSCKSVLRGGTQRVATRLDALILEPDLGRLTLIHRAVVAVGRSASAHRYSILRCLEDWEPTPTQVFRAPPQTTAVEP